MTIDELIARLEAMPKYDRGIHWELRNRYTGAEWLECHGQIANVFKWILDNHEELLATLRAKAQEDGK